MVVCRITFVGCPEPNAQYAGITNLSGSESVEGMASTHWPIHRHNTVYSESQGGNMNRLDLRTGRSVIFVHADSRAAVVAQQARRQRRGGHRNCSACRSHRSPQPAASPTQETLQRWPPSPQHKDWPVRGSRYANVSLRLPLMSNTASIGVLRSPCLHIMLGSSTRAETDFQITGSGRHMDSVSRSNQKNRPHDSLDHGCVRQRSDGFKE